MTTTTTNTVDRLIAGIVRRNGSIVEAANRAALLIISDPANLAGRAITLLEAMAGIRSQKNLSAFFDDFLPNEIVEKKSGGFILGKKRQDWVEPTLPESGLMPTTYINTAKAALLKAERVEKVKETKAKRESDQQAAIAAQMEREKTLAEKERSLETRLDNVRAIAADKVGKAEMAVHDARESLKAESVRLQVALSEKAKLERELNSANHRIQELELELAALRQVIANPVPAVPAVPVTRKGRKKTA